MTYFYFTVIHYNSFIKMGGLDYVWTSLWACILELHGLPARHKHLQCFLKCSVTFIFGLGILCVSVICLFAKYNVKLLFSRWNKEVIVGGLKNIIFNSAFYNANATAWFLCHPFFISWMFCSQSKEEKTFLRFLNLTVLQGSRYLSLKATSSIISVT